LIELVVVIAIISVLLTLFGLRSGTFNFWREESFLRRLSETMVFLHRQAVIDGSFYRIEFDLTQRQYKVGIIIPSSGQFTTLELELNEIVSPALATTQLMVDPPSFPSLAEPVQFPPDLTIERVKNPRGDFSQDTEENPFILFSPRGFSEFAVINIRLSDGRPVTVAVNSFTGLTQIYRDERDFDWTYGRTATH
jgi:type II secretory pathway pseudopilin PulG